SVVGGVSVHPVVGAVNAAEAAVESAGAANVWALSDDDVVAALDTLQRLAAREAELRLRLVAEVDARDLGRRHGGSSTAGYLRGRYNMRPADAKWAVQLANRATAATGGPVDYAANPGAARTGREMPATAEALAAGTISEDHAVVIAKAMHRLPERLDPAQGAEAERQLVALAHDYDPAALARLANCLLDALAPDTLDDDEDDAHRRRHLSLNHSTGRLHGRFTPEA